jgi:hypothetical protein
MNKIALKLPGPGGGVSIQEPPGFKFGGEAKIGDIISALLPYIFVLAGLVLFIFLIIGGFGLLTSGGNPDKVKAAQGKITSAVIGFVIIFISYWLVRILEIVLGIQIF